MASPLVGRIQLQYSLFVRFSQKRMRQAMYRSGFSDTWHTRDDDMR